MDINSLLSPQDSPLPTPPPRQTSPARKAPAPKRKDGGSYLRRQATSSYPTWPSNSNSNSNIVPAANSSLSYPPSPTHPNLSPQAPLRPTPNPYSSSLPAPTSTPRVGLNRVNSDNVPRITPRQQHQSSTSMDTLAGTHCRTSS